MHPHQVALEHEGLEGLLDSHAGVLGKTMSNVALIAAHNVDPYSQDVELWQMLGLQLNKEVALVDPMHKCTLRLPMPRCVLLEHLPTCHSQAP